MKRPDGVDRPKDYISREGHARLAAELDSLLRVERPRVCNNVTLAAAEGDRSENAEYIYGKKRLRQIDKRLEFLDRRLDALEVVERPRDTGKVVFLAWVELRDEEDATVKVYRLVGADETDAKAGFISWKSPVGRALLGRRIDDEVCVQTPGGEKVYTILGIYAEPP